MLSAASAAFDRAVTLAVQAATDEGEARRSARSEERAGILERMVERYAGVDLRTFHPEPVPLEPTQRAAGELARGLRVLDLTWSSRLEPFLPEVAERYQRTVENAVAAARLFTRDRGRPVAVLLHGYMTGHFAFEQRLWPIQWFDARGLDVALFVLPFHGRRADARRRGAPEFPGKDPRFANEGFRQAIFDLRGLLSFLRQRGHAHVGLCGMSLGGYSASLAATIEPALDFLVPIIPLASLADFAREQGALSTSPEVLARELALLDAVHRLVSPLAEPPRIAASRTLVIGARADRITPVSHARRLAKHLGAPLVTWPGGHLLQFGRSGAFAKVAELLGQLGIIAG